MMMMMMMMMMMTIVATGNSRGQKPINWKKRN